MCYYYKTNNPLTPAHYCKKYLGFAGESYQDFLQYFEWTPIYSDADWLALIPTPHPQHTAPSAQHSVCLSMQHPGPGCEATQCWSLRLLFLNSPSKEITGPHLSDQQVFLRAKKRQQKNAGGRKREGERTTTDIN